MPLTYTGRRVRPGGCEHPSVVDISVGLFRQPRFAGQGRSWFSVGDHSLFCDELVKKDLRERDGRLALLLHDAHEAMTGDVPSDWKDSQLKDRQTEIDTGIMDAFFPGGWRAYAALRFTVKRYDRRALVAEAQVIGPPATRERILDMFGTTDEAPEDENLLENLLIERAFLGVPPYYWAQDQHPGVREYQRRILELM